METAGWRRLSLSTSLPLDQDHATRRAATLPAHGSWPDALGTLRHAFEAERELSPQRGTGLAHGSTRWVLPARNDEQVGSIGEPRRPLSRSRCSPTTELTADAAATTTVGAEPHGAVGCRPIQKASLARVAPAQTPSFGPAASQFSGKQAVGQRPVSRALRGTHLLGGDARATREAGQARVMLRLANAAGRATADRLSLVVRSGRVIGAVRAVARCGDAQLAGGWWCRPRGGHRWEASRGELPRPA